MHVKRYEVATISEAVGKIKQELGPDAIILSARKIRSGPKQAFEVTAACDRENDVRPAKENTPGGRSVTGVGQPESEACVTKQPEKDAIHLLRGDLQEIKSALKTMQTEQSLRREIAEMKEAMNQFFDVLGMRKGRAPMDINRNLYLHLVGNGFSRAGACRVVEAVGQTVADPLTMTDETAFAAARDFIRSSLPVKPRARSEQRVKMFVGPTGVGKTTTLAKLAARFSMAGKMKVGLMTTDNYRIAATEQLGTYARIMGLPMVTASTTESFQAALSRFSDCDVVLVDTPGRGGHDPAKAHSLELSVCKPGVETILLLAATARDEIMQDVVSQYAAFKPNHLIITKIDEARSLGSLYDVIGRVQSPVSFVTCGQNVPQDIQEASPEAMAALLLGQGHFDTKPTRTGLTS